MAEEKDFNDILDDILLSEEKQHQESYEQGFKAASEAGNSEGYHLGYHRGAELGRELGYYLGIVTHYINNPDGCSSKVITQLTRVKELIDTFPRTNSEDHDILGIAENIRAQYKKACALLKISSVNPYDAGVSFCSESMLPTITKLQHHITSITKFLTPLLPLANCHMVEFLTGNHWENLLPGDLRSYLEGLELDVALDKFWSIAAGLKDNTPLSNWVHSAQAQCVPVNNDYCITRDHLQQLIETWGGEMKPEVKITQFMSSKKSYEVQTMSHLVASLHSASNSTCCVEAGGGRGHLPLALSLAYSVPSLTVDCDTNTIRNAEKRVTIIQKQWHAIAKRVNSTDSKYTINRNLHRFATAYITKETDFTQVVRDKFPEFGPNVKLLLTGLHTCGNLGPDSLRIFTTQPTTAAVFNVPCCYHLLSETIDADLFDVFHRDFGCNVVKSEGFPMSEYLRGYNLGRNARMLAAQSIDRVASEKQVPCISLLWRALLQVIIREKLPKANLIEGKLKRMTNCQNFHQYFKMADEILNLELFDSTPDSYLTDICKDIDKQWKKMVLFYLLRLCLAQVIESLILLDRLMFLFENGMSKVYLVKLFDPVLSPRCHSIVAVR